MPDLNLKVTDDFVSLVNKRLTWTDKEKLAMDLILASGDGAYSIDISRMDSIKVIIILADGPATVQITKNAVPFSADIESMFMYSPLESDRSDLETIQITATNSTDTKYSVYVYGESA